MFEVVSLMMALQALKAMTNTVPLVTPAEQKVELATIRDESKDEVVVDAGRLDIDLDETIKDGSLDLDLDEIRGELEDDDDDEKKVFGPIKIELQPITGVGEFGSPTNPIPLYPRIEPPLEIM